MAKCLITSKLLTCKLFRLWAELTLTIIFLAIFGLTAPLIEERTLRKHGFISRRRAAPTSGATYGAGRGPDQLLPKREKEYIYDVTTDAATCFGSRRCDSHARGRCRGWQRRRGTTGGRGQKDGAGAWYGE